MARGRHILVVDDEPAMRDACRQTLARDGYTVQEAPDGKSALKELASRRFDAVLLDLKMPGMNGLELLKRVRKEHPGTVPLVITGFATVESAVEAMRAGAADFVPKPFTPEHLRLILRRALDGRALQRENVRLKRALRACEDERPIVGDSPPMTAIKDLIRRVAPTDSTVLITGESGTGKELVARAIHQASARAAAPFVVVDCGTLVGTLFESELFGHVKGSFTGATATTHGRVELADGGTLFLDEVGGLDLTLQAKLLRLIQEREFTRVGSNQVIRVDVRIVAATNTDLLEQIEAGRFREDLFYRLSVVPLTLPPLRQRRADIPALAGHFLCRHSAARGKAVTRFNPDAMAMLEQHAWPGNVRELENVIERAVIMTEGSDIVPADLLYYPGGSETGGERRAESESIPVSLSLAEVERLHIERVLRQAGGNRAEAARRLGIDRKTLWRRLRRYGHSAHQDRGD